MKRLMLFCAAALLLATASTVCAEIKVSGDAYVGVADKYLWRGFNLSDGTAVVQGGMDLSFDKVTVSYWTNAQFKEDAGYQNGEAYETDITLDYSFDLGELVSVSVGDIYYTLDGALDTNELYLGATLNTPLSPSLTIYHDWDEFKDDRFYTLAVGHDLEAGPVTISLGALASYAENDGANEIWNTELSAGAGYAVTEQISLDASLIYSAPYGDDAKAAIDTELASALSVSLSF